MKWTGKTWDEFYKIKMIDRAAGYVDPDEDLQLEEEENQNEQEEELDPEEDKSEVIQVGQPQAEEPTETQLMWLVTSQRLQGQEARLRKVNQLQQEQDKH